MLDFALITSVDMAEYIVAKGQLVKKLLLPEELGGKYVPENTVFLPPHIEKIKDSSTRDLISSVYRGLTEVSIVPGYKGESFIPNRIFITAAHPGAPPEYELEIEIW